MTVTISQAERAYDKGARRARTERELHMRDEPSDDLWLTVTPWDVYGWVTGEKNPSHADLATIQDNYQEGYYDAWNQ